MHQHYGEIIERLGEPRWWGEQGVPRYCPFSPGEADSIYADQVALVRIECQSCGHPFDVCYSSSHSDSLLEEREDLAAYIRATVLEESLFKTGPLRGMRRELHYGDPPNICCCAAGPTMTAIPVRVLEFWRRDRSSSREDWTRDPALEVDVEPSWAEGDGPVEATPAQA
jgi:hypothetical protein